MKRRAGAAWTAAACAVLLSVSACGATSPPLAGGSAAGRGSTRTATSSTAPAVPSDTVTPAAPATTPTRTARSTATAPAATPAYPTSSAPPGTGVPYRDRPVIVIDPGHSRTIDAIDPRTGLNVSDYENEPEMHDVFKVALLVRTALKKAGYRVVMTKKRVDQRVDLAQRAYLANRVHAALAISIHDQAGSDGGIGFQQGNNHVYYQSVGTYRATPSGKRIYFRNHKLARISKRFGDIFRRQREAAQRVHVNAQSNVGYNLGSRGLAPGDIWIVQLLAKVPWIYNEAGGNSAGRVGLSPADRRTYARGLIAGVEKCVPVTAH